MGILERYNNNRELAYDGERFLKAMQHIAGRRLKDAAIVRPLNPCLLVFWFWRHLLTPETQRSLSVQIYTVQRRLGRILDSFWFSVLSLPSKIGCSISQTEKLHISR
jgi:hypothetical protein